MSGRPRPAAAPRPDTPAGGRRAAADEPVTSAFAGPVRHVYVHVPFCRARCDYCDFASLPLGDRPSGTTLDAFVEGVGIEWESERAANDVRHLHTLYFGGGTPSLLGPARLERLLELFRPYLTPRAEVTVEVNPEDVDDAFAAWAAAALVAGVAGWGVGGSARGPGSAGAIPGLRISLGVQSFAPALRAALGRRSQADPAAAFARLRAAGVGNLSVDLMHAIPGQTLDGLDADLAAVLDLTPDHLSWYELTLTPGTPLARHEATAVTGERRHGAGGGIVAAAPCTGSGTGFSTGSETESDTESGTIARRTLSCAGGAGRGGGSSRDVGQGVESAVTRSLRDAHEADDTRDAGDTRAELYRRIVRTLSRAGYDWYEVSNFARPGRKARHNLAYWRARPYVGLGPGAVSTVGARRWTDVADPEVWAAALRAGKRPPRDYEDLDAPTRARERLLLAARCGDSVPIGELAAGVDLSAAPPLAAAGLVSLHGGTLRVTRKGRHVANEVCVRLFRDTRLRG